jgi:hypothetical protein
MLVFVRLPSMLFDRQESHSDETLHLDDYLRVHAIP